MQTHPSLRTLRIVGLSFIPVMVGALILVLALERDWVDVDDDLARIGGWIAGTLGVVGVAAAVAWRSRVTERPTRPERLMTTFFLTLAVAESSLLVGFVFTIVAQDTPPFLVGLVLFAVSLAVILLSLGQVELETDATPRGLVR